MTKAELIIKFSNTVGITDADAKIFFELLLKRLSANLRSSQSIYIPEFGYFHLIKGKIKKPASEFEGIENSEELLDIILYSEEEKLSESETKGFVFNVPFTDEDDYQAIDSFFSLSIGKPVIPLRGVLTDNSYIPTSGYDNRRILELKVEEIIVKSKIITSEEQFPTLIIDARSYNSNELKLEKDEEDLDQLLSDDEIADGKEAKTEEANVVKNIAWDFGEDFSKKISAQSVFELADERINNPSTENVNKFESEKELEIIKDEENILDELLENEKDKEEQNLTLTPSEIVKSKDSELSVNDVDLTETEKLIDDLNKFEEVKSDSTDKKNAEEEISDEEFWKTASKYFETYNPQEMPSDQTNEFTEVKSTASNLGAFKSKESKIKLIADEDNVESIVDENLEEPIDDSSTENDDINIKTKRKGKKWIFIVLPILIICAAAAYYWYSQINKNSANKINNTELSLNSNKANIIERDYKIPITYPYLPENTVAENKIVQDKKISSEETPLTDSKKPEVENEKSQPHKNEIKLNTKNLVPKGSPVSVGNNIYKYGEIYVVQVASFRSKSIAENEAGRYRNKGYNSFVEPVEISGKGLWYRIKVGNFSSTMDAKEFISKNNR
jgi:cell division septation protein DedD